MAHWFNFLKRNLVQPDHPVPLAFPFIAPGAADSREAAVDMNVFHCVYGHANEFLLRETAKSLPGRCRAIGSMRPCARCSMAKGYRNSTKSRATEKLGRVFVDVSGPKSTHSLLGKKYIMLVNKNFTRYLWVYFLERKSDAADAFRKFLADVRADGVPSKVERVRSENGEFFDGDFGHVCRQNCINQEFTIAKSPELNDVSRELSVSPKTRHLPLASKPPSSFPASNCHHRRPSGLSRYTGRAKP